jgi:hypothetical protein
VNLVLEKREAAITKSKCKGKRYREGHWDGCKYIYYGQNGKRYGAVDGEWQLEKWRYCW